MKRCTRCILPDSYPGIAFDDDGVCILCSTAGPPSEPAGHNALVEAVAPWRNPAAEYDCTVAFSGGRDSSYILWYAVRRLGLRVLALFTDNGFVPRHTRENLRRAGEILGVEVRSLRYTSLERNFPGMLRAWIRRPSAAAVSLLCTGCTWGRRILLPKAAARSGIPLMLVGGGEPEHSFAEPLMASGKLDPSAAQLVRGFAALCARNPGLLFSPVRAGTSLLEYMLRYRENVFLRLRRIRPPRKKLFPYGYTGWNERAIMETITSELGWQKGEMCGTAWRSDCLIAPLKNYIYGGMLGFHKVDVLLSGMIRAGQIGRGEAIERLPAESLVDRGYLDSFLRGHGVTLEDLDDAIRRGAEGAAHGGQAK